MEKFLAGLTVERVVKENILLSPGPVVTYRAFKHGKRSSRSIAKAEYDRATESLQEDGLGRIVKLRVPIARAITKVFIKSRPDCYPITAPLTSNEFNNVFGKPVHRDITQPMVNYLQSNNFLQ